MDNKQDYEGFKNRETSEKFEMVGPSWRKGISWPGVFTGKYCDITPAVAEKLVAASHPDFKVRKAPPAADKSASK